MDKINQIKMTIYCAKILSSAMFGKNPSLHCGGREGDGMPATLSALLAAIGWVIIIKKMALAGGNGTR